MGLKKALSNITGRSGLDEESVRRRHAGNERPPRSAAECVTAARAAAFQARLLLPLVGNYREA